MNILNLLKPSDKIALIQGNNRVTFAELLESGGAFGSALSETGVKNGDSILLFVPLSIDLYIAMTGCWSIGAVPAFIDLSNGAAFIGRSIERLKPSVIVCDWMTGLIRFFNPNFRKIRPINVKKRGGKSAGIIDLPNEHPAIITFTSGSTGLPKAAVRTHGFLINQYNVLSKHLDFNENHVDLGTLPVFTLANMASGMTTLLPDKSLLSNINTAKLAKQAEHEQVTRMVCSPALFSALLSHTALPALKLAYLGGAPVYPSVLSRAMKHTEVTVVYGSTEAEPIASIRASDMSEEDKNDIRSGKGLLVGHVVPEVECVIGESGEILVSGDTVLSGYLDGIGDSENKIRQNGNIWHRTGDAGRFDEQSRLWLLGRVSQVINDQYGTLYPFCVECILDSRFGIRGAILTLDGERVVIIERNTVKADDVLEALKPCHISRVIAIRKLPMDSRHRAKIDYAKLLQQFR